jgi:hypothetical protein
MWILIITVFVFVASLISGKLLAGQVKSSAVLPISIVIGAVAWYLFINVVGEQSADAQTEIQVLTLIGSLIAYGVRMLTRVSQPRG